MTASQFLNRFLNEIVQEYQPRKHVASLARRRARRVGKILTNDADMGIFDFDLSGSLAKGTGTAPLSDVDILVYLEPEQWLSTSGRIYAPSTVLGLMEKRLELTYRTHIRNGNVQIRRQTHSVGILYAGQSSINIDVVPAMCSEDANAERICMIPQRGSGKWLQTSVRRQLTALNLLDGPGVPLRRAIRALKVWKYNFSVELHSYGIETVAMILVATGEATRSIGGIVSSTLEWLGDIPNKKAIWCSLFDHEDCEPGRYAACAFDPAIPKNNVLKGILTPDCRKIATHARRSTRLINRALDSIEGGSFEQGQQRVNEALGCDI